MPTTARGYPYPEATDQNNVPQDMEDLAEAINDDVGAHVATIKHHADVSGTAPSDGHVLRWNASLGLYVPQSLPSGVTDHGALTGLGDDDHPHYHTDTRGDARYISKSLVDAKGDLLVATANDTPARVPVGTDGRVFMADSSQSAGVAWKDVSGSLIASTIHNPAATESAFTTDTAFTDVDATDLAVSFVVPASGIVLVRLTAAGWCSAPGYWGYWNLREGSSNLAGTAGGVMYGVVSDVAGALQRERASLLVAVSGLTPGASKTYKWGFRTQNAANTFNMFRGQDADAPGPATMEVLAG